MDDPQVKPGTGARRGMSTRKKKTSVKEGRGSRKGDEKPDGQTRTWSGIRAGFSFFAVHRNAQHAEYPVDRGPKYGGVS